MSADLTSYESRSKSAPRDAPKSIIGSFEGIRARQVKLHVYLEVQLDLDLDLDLAEHKEYKQKV